MFLTNKCLLQILTFQEKVQAMKKEDFNFQPMVFTSRISLFHILIVEKILPNVTTWTSPQELSKNNSKQEANCQNLIDFPKIL